MRLELLLHALVIMFILGGLSESEGFAHLPQGHALKITTQLDDYSLEIIVYPQTPEVNRTSEIIVGIINRKTNAPFNGVVRINNLSAAEFSQGFYEVKYFFREAGNTSIVVELDQGRKTHKTDINLKVKEGSGSGRLFLGGILILLSLVFTSRLFLKTKKRE